MKNILLGFIILSGIFFSCSKDETCSKNDAAIVAPATETANIETYLTTNGITGTTKHSSGVYYKITQVGTGTSITNLCSVVLVNYAGRLTNGTYFDPTTPGTTSTASFPLGNVIVGWQKVLPLIRAGGKITLYIPPSLGYGNNPQGPIPANSILIFDIELVAVS